MPYEKPGIEIKQEQRSSTPILPSPDLESCLIGHGYHWQDPNWEDDNVANRNSIFSQKYDGSELTIPASGINDAFYEVVDGSVVVDLLGTKGDNTGTLTHLRPGDDFSVAGNVVTISGNVSPFQSGNQEEAQVRVGFLAHNMDAAGNLQRLTSVSEIEELIGNPVSWNPLAYCSNIAIQNSSASTYVYGLSDKSGEEVEHADARTELALHEVYALAVLDGSADISAYSNYVTTQSSPTGKKERIAIVNEEYAYSGTNADDAAGIRDRNSTYQNRRIFTTHPYSAYILETRHISTIKPSYISSVFSGSESAGLTAQIASDVTIGGKRYKRGINITESVWTHLVSNGFGGSDGLVTVLAPVPGYYYAAAIAGQIVGKQPEQPLTNVPVSGFEKTYKSQDIFIEDDLNTMAGGGTYILTQNGEQSPLVSRHQVSTDITSVAKRELSVTTALDFTAKFLRNALNPYIGRFNITPAFLKLVNSVLVSSALFLTRSGVVQDIKNITVKQDEVNPDTLNVELNVKVKFPVNYIKITLVF